ncbi:MAG: hypothetical protein U0230_24795 [Polyangiales bacterium]
MSRIAVIRHVPEDERVACILPGHIRSLGRRGMANPASDAELVQGLGTIGGRIEVDARFPGAYFVKPEPRAALYGGLQAWARVVEGYLRGRGYFPSIAVGADRPTTFEAARTGRGVIVLDTPTPPRPTQGRAQTFLPGMKPHRRRRAA